MILRYERSGGFTGMRVETTIDTDSMPADEVAELTGLVEGAGFFDLPATISSEGGADGFVHVLTVESAGRRHTVEASGTEIPERLNELLGSLGNRARRSRGS